MSAKPDGGLVGNHVGPRSALTTVDECDEDSPETPDETTPLDHDVGGPPAEDEDDVDEPMAVSSSEVTLSDTETKEAQPDGPAAADHPDETAAAAAVESEDQSTTTSDEFDPSTVVRRRRDAAAFIGDGVDMTGFKRRAAELGYSDEDDDMDEEDWESSEDEYIGLIPMLCARCMRCLRHQWFNRQAKRFLVIFNVIFCMCGIALVCIGLWMHIRHERLFYGVLLLDNPTSPFLFLRRLSLIVIGVGSVLTVMCFVGGCGAATECICFLVSHALLSTLCLVAQIVAAILSSVFQETIHANMSTSMRYQLRHLYNTTATRTMNTSSITYRVTVAWDELQRQLGCCGINGPADYHNSAWFNHTPESDGAFVPLSCCGATSQSYYCQFEAVAVIQAEQSTRNIVHSQGCFDAILEWYATYRPLVAFIVIFIDILLLIDIISSIVLVRTIQRKQAEYGWRPNYIY